jgi:hypothetical protein
MWIGDSAQREPAGFSRFCDRLREMGVTAGMVYGGGDPGPWLEQRMPYYVENIVNQGLCLKWNSKVKDWDRFVTDWAKDRDESGLMREYCLDDPQWRERVADQVRQAARKHGPHRPLAYDLRDELSVTISANPFDYDFSPPALAGFQQWLQTVYPSLPALNAEWETSFASWSQVRPFTTDRIKHRLASGEALPRGRPDWQAVQRRRFDPRAARATATAWNFSPWADFRTYLDLSLARVLDDLRQAAHEVDPHTPVGIEGTQMPHAFGGYDLERLAHALDWIEPYDIGNTREILGSFMPGKTILTTVFENQTNPARRRLWHLLLEGDQGCIIWWSEDCLGWQNNDWNLTPKARALAPVLKELTGPLARLFLKAARQHDPIAFCYSQPSIQADWLLESCVDGSTWLRRFSSFEADHNRLARVRNAWLKAFQDLGYSPRFIPASDLARPNVLTNYTVLVLPTALALSAEQARGVREFLKAGGALAGRRVFADGCPALFDEHGKLQRQGPFDAVLPLAASEASSFALRGWAPEQVEAKAGDISTYVADRLGREPRLAWAGWIADQTRHLRPQVQVPLAARVRVRRYQLGHARLLAFERNINYQMSEDLKQAGGNQQLEQPLEVSARLAAPEHVYDLRTQAYLGHTDGFSFMLDPWQPALFAVLGEKSEGTDLVAALNRLAQ